MAGGASVTLENLRENKRMTVEKMSSPAGVKPGTVSYLRFFGLAFIILYLLLYLAPLNTRPLITPDETRYAEIPREMLANHDWATLHQVGLPYYEKPPLGYWLTAASQRLFGQNNFAVRLPSALAAGLTALALFLLVRRVRGDSTPALIAAAIYLSCLQVFGVGTFAVLDTMFTLFVCLSLFCYDGAMNGGGAAGTPAGRGRRVRWAALSGAACGLAFLAKGLTALVLPALTLLVWLLWERRFRELLVSWIIPVLVAGLTVLPAALLIHRANPDFWRYFFWVEHVQRFLNPHGGQHRESFFFYLPVIAAGAVPWTFLMPAAAGEIGRRLRDDSLTRFCLAWFVSQFLFFSACGGKLPTYILPGFAPLALIFGEALLTTPHATWLRRGAGLGGVIFLAGLAGFMLWLPFSGQDHLRASVLGDSETWILAAALILAALCLFMAARRFGGERPEDNSPAGPGLLRMRGIGWTALALTAAAAASFLALPEGLEDRKSPSRLLIAGLADTPANAELLADRKTITAVAWHYRREGVTFFGDPGELAYGLENGVSSGRYFPTVEETAAWLKAALAGGKPVVLCMRDDSFAGLADQLDGLTPAGQRELSHFIWRLYLPGAGVTGE